MILGIMQPYFMPYIGYFQLMKAVDKYIVYDDVNYIKGGWVSRNNILENGQKKMFTIILKGASPNKLFNEIEIGDNFKKFLKTLQLNYSKAPYYIDVIELLERIFSFQNKQLAIFLANSYKEILSYLDIKTEIIMSSDISKDNNLKGKEKVKQICSLTKADYYFNAIGGMDLYDKKDFAASNITLKFLKPELKEYRQNSKAFIPGLSIIDVLMNNSKEETNLLLNSYELI